MDSKRASEIAASTKMINVTYNGKPIYIEDVRPSNDTAGIHFLDRPEDHREVPLSKLVEPKSF